MEQTVPKLAQQSPATKAKQKEKKHRLSENLKLNLLRRKQRQTEVSVTTQQSISKEGS